MVCIWLGAGHSEASGKKLQPPLACLQKYNIHKSIQKDKYRNTNVQCGPGVKIACSHLCSVHVTFRHLKAGAICIVVVCNVVFFKCIIANFVVLAKLTVFIIFLDCDLFFCSLFSVHSFLLL